MLRAVSKSRLLAKLVKFISGGFSFILLIFDLQTLQYLFPKKKIFLESPALIPFAFFFRFETRLPISLTV